MNREDRWTTESILRSRTTEDDTVEVNPSLLAYDLYTSESIDTCEQLALFSNNERKCTILTEIFKFLNYQQQQF